MAKKRKPRRKKKPGKIPKIMKKCSGCGRGKKVPPEQIDCLYCGRKETLN